MSKPLWGGSAAAVALLSASLLFYAQPSVAETLAVASQEIQQKTAAAETKAVASLRWALLERKAGKYNDSLEIYKQAAALIEV